MILPHISDPDTRRVVRETLDDPRWFFVGINGRGHGQLRFTPTGETLDFGMTPGDRNAWKELAKSVERISGTVVWRRGNRKPGRLKRATRTALSKRQLRERETFERAAETKARTYREALAREAERVTSARRAEVEYLRELEIRALMMPGHSRRRN